MHAVPRLVQQQQQKEQEKQHDRVGAITASQALDSNSSSTLSAARAPAERQQQQQHAAQRQSSIQHGRSRESNQQYQPQPGSPRDGTSPASSPELVRSRRSGQQDRAMQDSFRYKYIDQQQPAAGTRTSASQVVGVAGGQQQQQEHVVIGSTVAYEQPHAPNSYGNNMDNGHSAYHMAVAASQAQPQSQQQQQQITFAVGTQTGQDRWTEWTEMLQTGRTSLFDWQAVREVCGLGVPPAVAAGLVAPALSSSVPAPMITGPSFRPAIAAAPSSQQQQQHSPEQQRQQPSQQYQLSPPLAGPSTNPTGYYPPNAAPPTYPTASTAPPPPQAQALPGRAVNVQRQVPPPRPRAQLAALQQYQQQSDANMSPKKRARGRPKKTTKQRQQLVTMDATDEEFDRAVAAARGAIQAFETARTAYAEGWRANPATSRAPLPPIARSRVRAAVDVVSASPWRDGKKQVFGSTANPPLAIDEPYGDYVPNPKSRSLPAPARMQRITRLSDPLFIARSFPNTIANGGLAPVELHLTRKPCPATGRTMDLFAITPHPFYPYPAALKRLDKADVDKALEHINRLVDSSAQRVDLDQAASTTAGADHPDDRQRAQAIKTVLARHVRRAVQGSRPLDLPEDLRSQRVPKLAKRTWKLVKKVYPGPTVAASTSSAAASASEGAATTAAAQSAQPLIETASSSPKQVRSSSAAQSLRDGGASLPPQSSKPAPGSEIAISSPATAPLSRPDTPSSISAPLAEGSASTSSQAPIDAGGLSKPARPSLAAVGSPVSPRVVPGVRPRAKSIQGMRRVSSGPGVHPLAQLYATAPNTIRLELRQMSVAVPGVPSDPVAAALAAAAKKIQPRRRSMSMTASPRLPSSHKELAHPSPPLVPIPLAEVGASEESSVAKDTKGKARRLSVDPPHPKSGTSALGVTLDADTDAAVADSNSTNPADAMQIDSDEGAVRDEAADASVEVADSQPDEEDHQADADHASSASSSMFASAVSSVARAAGGALASAARAFMSSSGGGVPTARGPPVPRSPAANQPADAHEATSAKEGAGVPSESDKNTATAVPASKSTIAPAAAGGKPRLKSTAFDGTRVRLPPLHMSTEPLHPCALRELAVKKRWMQASEPFRPFGP